MQATDLLLCELHQLRMLCTERPQFHCGHEARMPLTQHASSDGVGEESGATSVQHNTTTSVQGGTVSNFEMVGVQSNGPIQNDDHQLTSEGTKRADLRH